MPKVKESLRSVFNKLKSIHRRRAKTSVTFIRRFSGGLDHFSHLKLLLFNILM